MSETLGYTVLTLVVYALAVARVTRLINADTITDPIRLAVERRVLTAGTIADQTEERAGADDATAQHFRRRQGQWSTLSYFLACPWCVSIWLVAATAWIPPVVTGLPLWWWPLIGLATSHLVGVAAGLGDDEDIEIVQG